jgi:hypothetical protein
MLFQRCGRTGVWLPGEAHTMEAAFQAVCRVSSSTWKLSLASLLICQTRLTLQDTRVCQGPSGGSLSVHHVQRAAMLEAILCSLPAQNVMLVCLAREVALDAAVVLPANMEVDLVRRHVSIVLLAHIVLLMAPSLARFVNLESMVLQLGQRHQLRVMLALLVPRVHLKGRIPLPLAPTVRRQGHTASRGLPLVFPVRRGSFSIRRA